MKNAAIITAGGVGKRYPAKRKKQYLDLDGKPILIRSVESFFLHSEVESIFVTAPEDSLNYTKSLLDEHFRGKNIVVVKGGTFRQESVLNALLLIADNTDNVLVHDGVRPLVTIEDITRLLELVHIYKAVVPGYMVRNTIKEVRDKKIVKTIPRDSLYEIYTPQVFAYDLLLECHNRAHSEHLLFTDDAGILEYYDYPVYLAKTKPYNIKITEPSDYEMAELLIKNRKEK